MGGPSETDTKSDASQLSLEWSPNQTCTEMTANKLIYNNNKRKPSE